MRAFPMVLVFAVLVLFGQLTAVAAVEANGPYRQGEIIVKYRDGASRPRAVMERIYQSVNVAKVKRFRGTKQLEQLILADDADLAAAIEELAQNPMIEFAEPNFILKALPAEEASSATEVARAPGGGIPCIPGIDIPGCEPLPCLIPNFPPGCSDNGGGDGGGEKANPPVADKPADVNPPIADPELSKAYGLSKIGAPEAWSSHQGSQDMIVAVIDTGVDYNHEDLSFNMWRNPKPDEKTRDLVGYDFVHDDGLPFDDHSHGTHCAGVIGAVGGNGRGISGVNQRVSIMAMKFLDGDGSGDEANAIRAIDYAVEHGARILSNSWGGTGGAADKLKPLKDAVARAEAKGALFVAAAGNDSNDNDKVPEFPGGFDSPNVLSVAATGKSDEMAGFSNWGKTTVHVAAPGVDIYSTVPGNKYKTMSGTSMACPHVAGAAALLWSARPSMSYKDVKARLMETVDKVSALEGKTVTGGRLNIARALKP